MEQLLQKRISRGCNAIRSMLYQLLQALNSLIQADSASFILVLQVAVIGRAIASKILGILNACETWKEMVNIVGIPNGFV